MKKNIFNFENVALFYFLQFFFFLNGTKEEYHYSKKKKKRIEAHIFHSLVCALYRQLLLPVLKILPKKELARHLKKFFLFFLVALPLQHTSAVLTVFYP